MDTDLIILEKFAISHPMDAAQTIEEFKEDEIVAIIDELPIDLLAGIVTFMNKYNVARYLKQVQPDRAFALIEKMDVLSSELILRQCEEYLRDEILNNISTKTASAIRQKLKHKSSTIGALMHPFVFSFQKDQIVKDAIKKVKQEKKRCTNIVPVVNAEGTVEGLVTIQDLFLEENDSLVESIMKTGIPRFSADLPIESVMNHPIWYKYQSVPVVDTFNKLTGILDFEMAHKYRLKSELGKINLAAETVSSIGELYRIGLSGFLNSISK